MRILHLIQRYWPARGGAEIHLGEISNRLAAEGHQVTVLTTDALDFELFWNPSCRRVIERESEHDGVRILRFPVQHLPFSQLFYPGMRRLLYILSVIPLMPTSILARLSRFTPWVPDLWQWIKSTDMSFDLVGGMTICFEPLLEAGLQFATRKNIPFVIYPLTHLGTGNKPGTDTLSRFYTMRHQVALVRASDALVAQTDAEALFYEARGIPSDRAIVAGPGVNPTSVLGGSAERFRAFHQIEGPVVTFLSAMSYDKGTVHLVEAIRELWLSGRKVELVLAGAILQPFQRYFASLPHVDQERIHLLGPIDEEMKKDLLAASDVVVVPSRTDSFGIIYLEAWLYGKPVIGAKSWGVDSVIKDGKSGLLVPFGDVSALSQAITYLLDNPSIAAQMGECGKQEVLHRHTWDHKYALIKNLYSQLSE